MSQKTRLKTRPNEPCPCKSGKKFKKCCGSNVGDLVYFVANPETDEAMENDNGCVMIFPDRAIAAIVAQKKKFTNGVLIPLPPDRLQAIKAAKIPYVIVTAKEFDVSEDKPIEEPKPEAMLGVEDGMKMLASRKLRVLPKLPEEKAPE